MCHICPETGKKKWITSIYSRQTEDYSIMGLAIVKFVETMKASDVDRDTLTVADIKHLKDKMLER